MKSKLLEIKEIEKESFVEHAKHIGRDPEELAKDTLKRIFYILTEQEKKSEGIHSINYYGIDFNGPAIDTLIEVTRRSAETYSDRVVKDLIRFIRLYGNFFYVDINSLKTSADRFGIDIQSKKWLYNYLRSIPLVSLFSLNVEAYVRKLDKRKSHVSVSRSLVDLSQFFLIPLVLNMLYRDCEPHNLAINRIDNPTYSYELASKYIIRLAKFYLGIINDKTISYDHDIFRITTPVAMIAHYLHESLLDFILLHEYCHIIYAHSLLRTEKLNEVDCDVLALNVLLSKSALHNAAIRNFMVHFKALTPIILFYFIELAEAIHGFKITKSHPHPAIRVKYVYHISRHIMLKTDKQLMTFDELFVFATKLFSTAIRFLKKEQNFIDFMNNLDESFLEGYNFACIPSLGEPIIFSVDFEKLKNK